jgi:hypothetical protein
MNWKLKMVWACVVGMSICGTQGWSEEAKGVISDTGFGSFTIKENDTLRQFNLSSKNSRYEPTTWRPAAGDTVRLTFTPVQGRGGSTVLAVDAVTLVQAGPNTIADLKSPVTGEIVEVGRSGVRAKIAGGHVLRFVYGRGVQKTPVGWVPVVGEKALIEFRGEEGFGFSLNYVADKMAKVP